MFLENEEVSLSDTTSQWVGKYNRALQRVGHGIWVLRTEALDLLASAGEALVLDVPLPTTVTLHPAPLVYVHDVQPAGRSVALQLIHPGTGQLLATGETNGAAGGTVVLLTPVYPQPALDLAGGLLLTASEYDGLESLVVSLLVPVLALEEPSYD